MVFSSVPAGHKSAASAKQQVPSLYALWVLVTPAKRGKGNLTIQLTSDLPDSGVKSAHIHLYTARFILVLEQIRGNLNSYVSMANC
jgi:hypothetical protein